MFPIHHNQEIMDNHNNNDIPDDNIQSLDDELKEEEEEKNNNGTIRVVDMDGVEHEFPMSFMHLTNHEISMDDDEAFQLIRCNTACAELVKSYCNLYLDAKAIHKNQVYIPDTDGKSSSNNNTDTVAYIDSDGKLAIKKNVLKHLAGLKPVNDIPPPLLEPCDCMEKYLTGEKKRETQWIQSIIDNNQVMIMTMIANWLDMPTMYNTCKATTAFFLKKYDDQPEVLQEIIKKEHEKYVAYMQQYNIRLQEHIDKEQERKNIAVQNEKDRKAREILQPPTHLIDLTTEKQVDPQKISFMPALSTQWVEEKMITTLQEYEKIHGPKNNIRKRKNNSGKKDSPTKRNKINQPLSNFFTFQKAAESKSQSPSSQSQSQNWVTKLANIESSAFSFKKQ